MAKIGNESKLILKLAQERMKAARLDWVRRSSNPNADSNNQNWLSGYEYAWKEWDETLYTVAHELES